MARIRWTADARVRYRTLIDHISKHNPSASKKIAARIRHVLEHAAQRPLMFRMGRVPGTREAVAHPNYIVVYRVEATTILVVAVLHARQIYP